MSRILILDAAGGQLTFLKYFLEKKDYTVKILSNTFSLLSEIHNYKPDLLILDALFGRDLCKELRSRPETKGMGILIFSHSAENLTDYRSYAADDYIEKPFNLSALSDKIKSLLSWIPIRKKALSVK